VNRLECGKPREALPDVLGRYDVWFTPGAKLLEVTCGRITHGDRWEHELDVLAAGCLAYRFKEGALSGKILEPSAVACPSRDNGEAVGGAIEIVVAPEYRDIGPDHLTGFLFLWVREAAP
jgi:hypothetical protein